MGFTVGLPVRNMVISSIEESSNSSLGWMLAPLSSPPPTVVVIPLQTFIACRGKKIHAETRMKLGSA